MTLLPALFVEGRDIHGRNAYSSLHQVAYSEILDKGRSLCLHIDRAGVVPLTILASEAVSSYVQAHFMRLGDLWVNPCQLRTLVARVKFVEAEFEQTTASLNVSRLKEVDLAAHGVFPYANGKYASLKAAVSFSGDGTFYVGFSYLRSVQLRKERVPAVKVYLSSAQSDWAFGSNEPWCIWQNLAHCRALERDCVLHRDGGPFPFGLPRRFFVGEQADVITQLPWFPVSDEIKIRPAMVRSIADQPDKDGAIAVHLGFDLTVNLDPALIPALRTAATRMDVI